MTRTATATHSASLAQPGSEALIPLMIALLALVVMAVGLFVG